MTEQLPRRLGCLPRLLDVPGEPVFATRSRGPLNINGTSALIVNIENAILPTKAGQCLLESLVPKSFSPLRRQRVAAIVAAVLECASSRSKRSYLNE